jgi:hypothetical protein
MLVPMLLIGGSVVGPADAQALAQRGRGDGPDPAPRIDPRPAPRGLRPWRPLDRRNSYQEAAFSRGYDDGYKRGLDDSRQRDRYDPVGDRAYQRGDPGYSREYGSRDAYKYRYREAFREGYEDGYGDGQRYDSRTTRNDGRPTWWPW